MNNVLVTGADGYCGWPLVLRLLNKGYKVIGVDNGGRRLWVDEIGGKSTLPIADIDTRVKQAKRVYNNNYNYMHMDLVNYPQVNEVLKSTKPDAIIHLAAQPSAPYSQIDITHCNYTQENNMQSTRNLLWSMKELGMKDVPFIMATTTGIYGAPDFDIPEGGLVINKMEIPYPAMSGSWYHMSHAHNAGNLWLAERQFKFNIAELRTSIVCGSSTEETRSDRYFRNRFDVDFYFGVVVNRFVAQAMSGKPITIYGKGEQMKPMISLDDMVRTTANAINNIEKGYNVYNQFEVPISIVEIANTIKESCEKRFNEPVKVEHIPNPRIEDEEHEMVMRNKRFILKLAESQIKVSIVDAIDQICQDLYPYKHMFSNFMGK